MDFLTVARHGVVQAVVKDGWKMTYRWSSGEKTLYDVANDPEELVDLYATEPEQAATMWQVMQPEVDALDAAIDTYTPRE
jgi:arylsulfatase A-like enzyme